MPIGCHTASQASQLDGSPLPHSDLHVLLKPTFAKVGSPKGLGCHVGWRLSQPGACSPTVFSRGMDLHPLGLSTPQAQQLPPPGRLRNSPPFTPPPGRSPEPGAHKNQESYVSSVESWARASTTKAGAFLWVVTSVEHRCQGSCSRDPMCAWECPRMLAWPSPHRRAWATVPGGHHTEVGKGPQWWDTSWQHSCCSWSCHRSGPDPVDCGDNGKPHPVPPDTETKTRLCPATSQMRSPHTRAGPGSVCSLCSPREPSTVRPHS